MEKAIRILVIDDHPATRNMMSVLLQQIGYSNLSFARDGVEALAELKANGCDLILSDWHMPEMDGLTLFRKIRQDDALRDIPLILVTAVNDMEMVKTAIAEGIRDYMVKPITVQALTMKIKKARAAA